MSDQPRYLSLNGVVTPYADAKVHVQAPLVRYGAGVFEGIAGYWNEQAGELYLFRLDDHLRRLRTSMRIMRFDDALTVEAMRAGILELIRANEFRADLHVRIIVWVDGEGEQYATGPLGWSIAAIPRRRTSSELPRIRAGVSTWQRLPDLAMPPRVKSVANYGNGRLAWTQAKEDGYDTALLLTREGYVSESPSACFFVVRGGRVATPRVTDSILESITRTTVIALLEEMGHVTVERAIDRTEVYGAEEAFLCGSGQEIGPVVSLDHHVIGDGSVGPLTAAVAERYFEVVRGTGADHAAWRTPVYEAAR